MSLITIDVRGQYKSIQEMLDSRVTDYSNGGFARYVEGTGNAVTWAVNADDEWYYLDSHNYMGAIVGRGSWNYEGEAGDAFFAAMFLGMNGNGTAVTSIAYNDVFTTFDMYLYQTNLSSHYSWGYVLEPQAGSQYTTYWDGLGIPKVTFNAAVKAYVEGNHSVLDNLMAAQQYVFKGGDSSDTFTGGNLADTISGGLGSNRLEGGLGNDVYILGDGADYITDAGGRDTVQFTHATVLDWVGNQFTGDVANDYFSWDTMEVFAGSEGDDTIRMPTYDSRGVEMWGNGGRDSLTGSRGNDILHGGNDGDWLTGGWGADKLYGDEGDDYLNGGYGNDTLDGGAGKDFADYSDRSTGFFELGWTFDLRATALSKVKYGTATTVSTISRFPFAGNEVDRLYNIEGIVGTVKADTFYVDNRHTVYAGDGNDTIYLSYRGSGIGDIDAGAGTGDTIDFSTLAAGVRVKIDLFDGFGLTANAAIKTASTSIFMPWTSLAIVNRVENVTGSAAADVLTGNMFSNIIHGGAGGDTIAMKSQGFGAIDTLYGDAGVDLLDLSGFNAAVSITLPGATVTSPADCVFTTDTASINAGTLRLIARASGFEDATGSAFADTITGNASANRLSGYAGDDSIAGGGGADVIAGGLGRDTLTGGNAGTTGGDGAADIFAFYSAAESGNTAATCDLITDFVHLVDKVDLSVIDAIAGTAANDAFKFVGTAAFSGVAGQLRYEQSGGNTYISADINGDRTADLMIGLTGLRTLTAQDFVL